MAISFKSKLIFVHIPKNAGTAVINFPAHEFVNTGHCTIDYYKKNYPEEFKTFTKVAIVRNPWDRFVSCYSYALMNKSHWHSEDNTTKYGMHPDHALLKELSFEQTVNLFKSSPERFKHEGWGSQYSYIYNNGTLQVDHVFKYEHISTDALFTQLFPNFEGSKVNVSIKQYSKFLDYYSPETVEIVASCYKEDIARFNYSFKTQA